MSTFGRISIVVGIALAGVVLVAMWWPSPPATTDGHAPRERMRDESGDVAVADPVSPMSSRARRVPSSPAAPSPEDLRARAEANATRYWTDRLGPELAAILALPVDLAWAELAARPPDLPTLAAAMVLVAECRVLHRTVKLGELVASPPASTPWLTDATRDAIVDDIAREAAHREACDRSEVTGAALIARFERSSLAPGIAPLMFDATDGPAGATSKAALSPEEVAKLRDFLARDVPVELGVLAAQTLLETEGDAARIALQYLERHADTSSFAATAFADCMSRGCGGRRPADADESLEWLAFGAHQGDIDPYAYQLVESRRVADALAWYRIARDLEWLGCSDGARHPSMFLVRSAEQQYDRVLARATAAQRAAADATFRELQPVVAAIRARESCD